MYYTTIKLENDFFVSKMAAQQTMYWIAAKIDGHTVGTLALPIFNQTTEIFF